MVKWGYLLETVRDVCGPGGGLQVGNCVEMPASLDYPMPGHWIRDVQYVLNY
jgi:hypothetical protein